MSVTVNELVESQTAIFTRNGWELSRTWKVTLENHVWGPEAAVNAVRAQAAEIGDRHPLNGWVFLNKLTPTVAGDRLHWDVRGDYTAGTLNIAATQNPLEAPTEVAWSSATYSEPVTVDIDGNAVVNSAGQPFDPPLTQDRHPVVATIVYNSESYDPNTALNFQDYVNDAPATIANLENVPERMARILEIGATQQYWEDITYWRVTVKVEINNEPLWDEDGDHEGQGWDRRVLDQGLFEKITVGEGEEAEDKTVRMRTDDGEEVTEPLKLDGEGGKLDPQTDDPVFLTYKTFKEADFSQLNLATV